MEQRRAESTRAAQARVLESDILGAKQGDWTPRTTSSGLHAAADLAGGEALRRHRRDQRLHRGRQERPVRGRPQVLDPASAPSRFQIFAVDFIEKQHGPRGEKGPASWRGSSGADSDRRLSVMTPKPACWIAAPLSTRTLEARFPGHVAGPLEVDIGCGKGRFLAGRARRPPGP